MPCRPSAPSFYEIGEEDVVAIDRGSARRNLVGRELMDGVAQHVDRLAEGKARPGRWGIRTETSGGLGNI
jgi:hypothetical protein